MYLLSNSELLELLEADALPKVSLYMPTHRAGAEIAQDPIRLGNLLDEAEAQLLQRGVRRPHTEDLLQPARDLIPQAPFWEHQRDGLALFLSPNVFRFEQLPLRFQPLVVLGERFHIKPLLPLLSGDGRFYILAISQQETRLLEATRYTVDQVELDDVPATLRDALRWDEPVVIVNWHSGTGSLSGARGRRRAMFHGHGHDNAKLHKEHVLRYLRKIASGIDEILHEESAPLVLAAVDYIVPLYEEASGYAHITAQSILGNPDQLRPEELQRRAWQIVGPHFASEQHDATQRYLQLCGSGSTRASGELEKVAFAALDGRIESLFVARDQQIWGTLDRQERTVERSDADARGAVDLLDLAAVYTLRNGGQIYAVPGDAVPGGGLLAAIYRF